MVCLVLAKTETVELREDESFEIKDKNLTILKLDHENDKIIACVNNEKAIVSDEADKTVNGLLIHIKSVRQDYARVEVTRRCTSSKCNCEETPQDCSNIECYNECDFDSECDDNNENTNDFCRGTPKKCVNIEKKPVECTVYSDCYDGDECTIDECISETCNYREVFGCESTVTENGKETKEENGKENEKYFTVFLLILFLIIIIILFYNILKKK